MQRIFLLLVLLLSGCAHVSKPEMYSVGCVALDLATTQVGLSAGYVEQNPIYPEGYEILTGVIVGVAWHMAMRWYLNRTESSKSPAWYGYGSVRCAAGIYNIGVISNETNP